MSQQRVHIIPRPPASRWVGTIDRIGPALGVEAGFALVRPAMRGKGWSTHPVPVRLEYVHVERSPGQLVPYRELKRGWN